MSDYNTRERENKMIFLQIFLSNLFLITVKCDEKEEVEKKNPLPYFRRQLEMETETPNKNTLPLDDDNNLVSLLVRNVKEIFDDDEASDISESHPTPAEIKIRDINTSYNYEENINHDLLEDYVRLNSTRKYLIGPRIMAKAPTASEREKLDKQALMVLAKEIKSIEKTDELLTDIKSNRTEAPHTFAAITPHSKRSCIYCNNVVSEDCYNPKNKLISSTLCDGSGDLCYSQHTPFGIVDRGCYNVNFNLSTYVCACNLCNYISISEMPYIFTNMRDWLDNVVELSRTRNFRRSVFKDMACLRCEVNTTSKKADLLDTANCLEGVIGSLPTQICEYNEICAVKAIRQDGYIWRGCVKSPLYNYWWSFCDSDICNYDTLVSLYDL